jgi:hypothetical protein
MKIRSEEVCTCLASHNPTSNVKQTTYVTNAEAEEVETPDI